MSLPYVLIIAVVGIKWILNKQNWIDIGDLFAALLHDSAYFHA